MTADGKIAEAERWLNKISNSDHRKDRTALGDNVNAFLNTVNSIPDHLLEEYQQKFGLGIPLNKYLDADTFEKAAKRNGNKKAENFISIFKSEKAKIESEQTGKILTKKEILILTEKTKNQIK